MTGICLPIDASAGSPSFPAAQHRVALGALMTTSKDRPLGARSGIRPGGEPTITVSATTWTVTPFSCIVDPGTALTVGPYLVAFLANETGSIDAADATYARIDRLDVVVPDDPPGADPRNARIVLTKGVASASPALPAGPARSLFLGYINVPKAGGGAPSFSPYRLYATAAGGVLPVETSDRPTANFRGQYIDDPTQGLLRWDGAAWAPPVPALPNGIDYTLTADAAVTPAIGGPPWYSIAQTVNVTRKCLVELYGSVQVLPSGNAAGSLLVEVDTVQQASRGWLSRSTSYHQWPSFLKRVTLTPGSHTIRLGCSVSAGSFSTSYERSYLSIVELGLVA